MSFSWLAIAMAFKILFCHYSLGQGARPISVSSDCSRDALNKLKNRKIRNKTKKTWFQFLDILAMTKSVAVSGNKMYWPSFAALREKLYYSAAQFLENRWHCASDKKKFDWCLNGISHDDFDTTVEFFSVSPIIFFLVQPFLLTSIPLCMFWSSSVICIVNSINSLDELF